MMRELRAFPGLVRVGFVSALAYRAEFLVWMLAYTMPLIMLALWTAVAAEAPLGRFGEKEFSAYFIATLLVRLSSGAWVAWDLNFEVRQGTLQRRLLWPTRFGPSSLRTWPRCRCASCWLYRSRSRQLGGLGRSG